LLGYDYADPAFQKILEASKFPFTVTEGPNKKPLVTVEFKGKEESFSPEELVSVLFRQIKQTASQYMGFAIEKAVISVPTHYNDKQKEALMEAARLAELTVLSLCTEPSAVALAYKLDEPPAKSGPASAATHAHQNVVVVDMGGMSTNISVLGVQDGIMEMLGFDQDTHVSCDSAHAAGEGTLHFEWLFAQWMLFCMCCL
jgi:molecular chaperone DnaK (HSP70)